MTNDNVTSLFDLNPENPCQAFLNIRDSQGDIRYFIENNWPIYKPYADKDFVKKFPYEFLPCFWEMYLTCTLLHLKLSVKPKKKKEGPDILLELDNNRIWVEAIAPTGGAPSKPDSVPKMKVFKGDSSQEEVVASKVPEEKIILRLTSAIVKKYEEKYSKYLNKRILDKEDCYIIAINGTDIPSCPFVKNCILKAVFPMGHLQFLFDRNSGSLGDPSYSYRPEISRNRGMNISTEIFLDPHFKNLSAVLFSTIGPGCDLEKVGMGEDFILVHNPLAKNPLTEGLIKTGLEWFAKETNDCYELTCKNWNENN